MVCPTDGKIKCLGVFSVFHNGKPVGTGTGMQQWRWQKDIVIGDCVGDRKYTGWVSVCVCVRCAAPLLHLCIPNYTKSSTQLPWQPERGKSPNSTPTILFTHTINSWCLAHRGIQLHEGVTFEC